MRGLSHLFWYLVYFFQAETSALRKEAFEAAREYYHARPVRNKNNPYPRVGEYQYRLAEFQQFQRSYINSKSSQIASEKLALRYGQ